MKKIIFTLMLLTLPSLSFAGACDVNSDGLAISSAGEICYKGDVQFLDIKENHGILGGKISRDRNAVVVVVDYRFDTSGMDPEDAYDLYKYGLVLFKVEDGNVVQRVISKGERIKIEDPPKGLCQVKGIAISNDGKTTYIECPNYATSGGIHAVDNSTGKISEEITAGSGVDIVGAGEFSGYILTSQHRYHDGGGSYDSYYLVSPDGKVKKRLTDDDKAAKDFLIKNR